MGLKEIIVVNKHGRSYKKLVFLLNKFGISESDLAHLKDNMDKLHALEEKFKIMANNNDILASGIARLTTRIEDLEANNHY